MTYFRRCSFLILTVILSLPVPGLQAQTAHVGVILSLEGPTYLRLSSRGPEIRITAPRDLGRLLVAGQALRCERGGRVTFKIVGQDPQMLTVDRGPFELRSRSGLSVEAQREADALNAFGRSGGSRALATALYAPANGGAVRLETFRMRWIPQSATAAASLEMRDASGKTVWTKQGVPQASGELPATAAAELLGVLGAADASGVDQRWTIVLSMGSDLRWSTSFNVLPAADAEQLRRVLDQLSSEPDPMLRTIRRGYEFQQRNLYNDLTDEYDRAITATPSSDSLRRAAVEANLRTGNIPRAQELTRQLEAR